MQQYRLPGYSPMNREIISLALSMGCLILIQKKNCSAIFFLPKGLTFNEFNRLAFYKDEHDNYYFGTLNGVNIFKKKDILSTPGGDFPLQWTKLTKVTNDGDQHEWNCNFSDLKKITLQQEDDFIRLECYPAQLLDAFAKQVRC